MIITETPKSIGDILVGQLCSLSPQRHHQTWRLNERHYGGLTGLNKAETAEKHGEAQVDYFAMHLILLPRMKNLNNLMIMFRSKFGGGLSMSPLRI